ncbi:DUF998 domain-containing protein [Natrinema ejinorense]|uniref:DUF998 domain-containing protein n=1 Tax=Natrinema ejinorense TaxID=373386 RepID=A0A2A5QX09_9EURY|nr:DUF998 domain-containing protein [Natrinema ejinorense]PCR91357.1 hypothetical protein CP557_12990 [Natrinema ejinorense]
MADRKRVATYCGIAGAILSLGAITLGTVIAPPETFTWQGRALSDMGRYGAPTFPLFNGGLILGGLVGLPFAWRLWITCRNSIERLGVVLLSIAVVGMIGVGVFFLEHTALYLETSLHGVAALSVFGVAPFASWVYGSGAALAGDGRLAVASVWFGNVHPLAWLGWLLSLGGEADTSTWFAVPEFVAAVAFGGWIVVLAVTLRRRNDSEPDVPNR